MLQSLKRNLHAIALLPLLLFLAAAAVGRQKNFEAISPTDLAFFHQSTWNAARGAGFAQTILTFDGSQLFHCIHLSLSRLLPVPFYLIFSNSYILVTVQAVAVGLAAVPLRQMVKRGTGSPSIATIASMAFLFHPWTLELACADFRPIVFLVPGILWAACAILTRAHGQLFLACLLSLSAREEAPWALLALLPLVLFVRPIKPEISGAKRARTGKPPSSRENPDVRKKSPKAEDPDLLKPSLSQEDPDIQNAPSITKMARLQSNAGSSLILLLSAGAAIAFLSLVWGRLSNFTDSAAPLELLERILKGERALFRSPEEARYGLVALVAAFPALLAPELLVIAVAGWGVLTIFSSYESVSAGGLGVHYLAIVHPFLMAGAGLGLCRLLRIVAPSGSFSPAAGGAPQPLRPRRSATPGSNITRPLWPVGGVSAIVLTCPLVLGWQQSTERFHWATVTLGGEEAKSAELARLIRPAVDSKAGGLCEPRVSSHLANREILFVVGEFQEQPKKLETISKQIEWAILRENSDISLPLEPVAHAGGFVYLAEESSD